MKTTMRVVLGGLIAMCAARSAHAQCGGVAAGTALNCGMASMEFFGTEEGGSLSLCYMGLSSTHQCTQGWVPLYPDYPCMSATGSFSCYAPSTSPAANSWTTNHTYYTGGTSGGGGGGGCLVAGTPVTMADGSTRNIEDVRTGDRVMSYDTDTGSMVASEVVQTHVRQDTDGIVQINGELRATTNHPFYANGRWVRADELAVGDSVIQVPRGLTGVAAELAVVPSKVTSLQQLPGRETVYNLTVKGAHNYFVGGLLVHNMKKIPY